MERRSAWWAEPPAWAIIDLGREEEIDRVWIQPWWVDGENGRAYQYTIDAATTRTDDPLAMDHWQTVVDMSANRQPAVEAGTWHRFPPVRARYIRIKDLNNLCEIKVYRVAKP
jgi:hypothetical protein